MCEAGIRKVTRRRLTFKSELYMVHEQYLCAALINPPYFSHPK